MPTAFRRFPGFANRTRRVTNGKNSRSGNRSQAPLQPESLEPRAMLSVSPAQMASGAEHSRPVMVLGDPQVSLAFTTPTSSIIAEDVYGQPIDFDQDGLSDVIFSSGADEVVGYLASDALIAASRAGISNVGFGSPNGLTIPQAGPTGILDLPGLAASTNVGVFDATGDGYADIIQVRPGIQGSDSTIHIYRFDPSVRNFESLAQQTVALPGLTDAEDIEFLGGGTYGDFNGDTVMDLVVPVQTDSGDTYGRTSRFQLYFGQLFAGSWSLDPSATLAFDVGTIDAAAAQPRSGRYGVSNVTGLARDFDNDGDIDLALPTNTGIRLYSNPGDGQFNVSQFAAIDTAEQVAGLNLLSADFNGDGLLDIASTGNQAVENMLGSFDAPQSRIVTDTRITVYLNTSAAGGLSAQAASVQVLNSNGNIPASLVAADFNLDGHVDLAANFANRESQAYGIAYGDGTGSFPQATLHVGVSDTGDPIGNARWGVRTVSAIAAVDVDGDGQTDVVTAASDYSGGIEFPANTIQGMSLYGVSYNNTLPPLRTYSQLPAGQQGVPYVCLISATGGDSSLPYSYALSSLSSPLPDGLTLGSDGKINGVPSRSGSFTIVVDVSQSNGLKTTSLVSLRIAPNDDTVQPSVVDIGSIAPNPRNTPLDSISVRFSEPLSPATFTYEDLTLTLNGQPVSLAGVSITTADNTVFSINGLASATDAVGAYELTVDGRGVTDIAGNVGNNQLAVNFVRTNFDSVLTLTDDGRWILSTSDGTQFHNSIFGRWATTDVNGAPLTWTSVLQGDVNGDGLTDVIGRTNIGQWWATINNGDGTGRNQLMGYWKANTDFYDIVAGDFNGDGKTDVAGRTASGQWWNAVANSAGNGFDTQRFGRWNSALSWSSVLTGDFDGDGRDDIAGLADNGHWWGLLGQSDGTGTSHLLGSWDLGLGFRDIVTGDFNGDGRTDIAGRSDGGTWWGALANSATIGFTNTVLGVWSAGTQWNNVVTGDFDGDGLTDIAGRAGDGAWWGMYSNGSAGPRSSRIIGQWDPAGRWAGVATGDANGDGRSDIVGRDATTLLSARGRFSTSLSGGGVLATQAWGSINTPEAIEARATFFSRF